MTTARWTGAAFVAAGALFLLFPLLRPWPDEATATAGLATAFASDRWVVSHLCGILALGLLAPALLGLRTLLADGGADGDVRDDGGRGVGAGRGAATWALVTAWVGAGCAALYFGAEIFGIRTIAGAALRDDDLGLLADVEVLRMQPWAVALFGVGLLLVAMAGVLVAVALWRSGAGQSRALLRWAGVPLAVGLALLLPQFFADPWLRITHGALLAAACLLVAAAVGALSRPTADLVAA